MTPRHLQERIDLLQAQRAAQWLETLRGGRPKDIAAFADWCRESPVHIREFLEATWLHHELVGLQKQDRDDVDTLLREATAGLRPFPVNSATRLSTSLERTPSRKKLWLQAAAVAGILATGALAAVIWQHQSNPDFLTQIGEQRTVELADATLVKLNTDSEIQVAFKEHAREVELRHGEAVFRVAQDKSRPFRVHTRTAEVVAIGTQFNVYDRSNGTDVTVLEGRVRVTATPVLASRATNIGSQELVAGEEALIGPDGAITRVVHPDVERVASWSKRRLKFERATLEEIVSEFNRYNRVRFRIEGIEPGWGMYRGVFDADDPESLADLLSREPELRVERHNGDIVIKKREP